MGEDKLFEHNHTNMELSLSGDLLFFDILPCSNCKGNVWEHDWVFWAQSGKKRHRYECFYCGQDYYPGGPVNYLLIYGTDNTERIQKEGKPEIYVEND